MGIVCFLLGGLVLGRESEQPIQQVSNSPQTQEDNATEADSDNNTESDDKSQSSNGSGLTQMQLGEAYTITTSGGDYNVAIEGIRFTDERNQFSEKPAEYVIFLDFNYENVSSTDEVYLFDSHFKVIDEQGNVLDTYPVSDDARSSKSLPIGARCSASATYAMPTSSKTLKVLFYDNMFGSPIGEMTIETGL